MILNFLFDHKEPVFGARKFRIAIKDISMIKLLHERGSDEQRRGHEVKREDGRTFFRIKNIKISELVGFLIGGIRDSEQLMCPVYFFKGRIANLTPSRGIGC